MRVRSAVSGVALCLFAPFAAAQTATATATAATLPSAAADAARSGTANQEDMRGKPGNLRGGGFGAGMGIRIQGDGIGLPPGVGSGSPGANRKEQEDKKEDEKKQAAVSAGCVGPNRDGQGCVEKESDSVARKMEQGLEQSPGATRPTDTRVQGTGIATPRCFGDSRDGVDCAK